MAQVALGKGRGFRNLLQVMSYPTKMQLCYCPIEMAC